MSKVVVKSQIEPLYKQEIKAGPFTLLADAPKEAGGSEAAPDPHELLLSSLGACTSITMQMFAKRRGWDLKEVSIELSEEKVDDPQQPGKQMSKITREINVKGDLTQEQIDGLRSVADKCPIHKLLTGSKEVVTSLKNG
jgi:putative redox protein